MATKKLLDLEGLQYYHRKLKSIIGDLSALTTDAKSSLVAAINEAENDAIGAAAMATSAQTTANEALAKAEASGHTHGNKALLDTYTQTEANLADAVAKKHEHANMDILTGITAAYTTAEKTKLAGIAEGAQVNVIETVKVNGSALTITDKAVDITVAAPSDATITLVDNGSYTASTIDTFTLNQASAKTLNVFDSITNAEIDALFV